MIIQYCVFIPSVWVWSDSDGSESDFLSNSEIFFLIYIEQYNEVIPIAELIILRDT